MRFGHSLIAGVIKSFNIFGSEVDFFPPKGGWDELVLQTKSVPLTKSQFAPYDLYDNLTLESFVRGLATQKAQVDLIKCMSWWANVLQINKNWYQAMDADMSAELTDHLFQQDDEKFGLDLVFSTPTQLNLTSLRHSILSFWC